MFEKGDEAPVRRLLTASWPRDREMRSLAGGHGLRTTEPWRLSMMAEASGEVIGVATLRRSTLHPARDELTGTVAAGHRRQGIASALLDALIDAAGDPAIRVRTRPSDHAGLDFLVARGFQCLMRSRTARVDPAEPQNIRWAERAAAHAAGAGITVVPIDPQAVSDDLFRIYQALHTWDPPAPWTAQRIGEVFAGPATIAGASGAALRDGERLGAATLLGPPVASSHAAAYLVWFGALDPRGKDRAAATAAVVTRALLSWAMRWSREKGRLLEIEVDDAHVHGSAAVHELASTTASRLILLARDATQTGAVEPLEGDANV